MFLLPKYTTLYKWLLLIPLYLGASAVHAEGFTYEHRKSKPHSIHIVTISPSAYAPELVKAQDKVIGRETVPEMAKEQKATIAINAGFFFMDEAKQGQPTGTLIIDNQIYGLKQSSNDYLLITPSDKLEIKRLALKLDIQVGSQLFKPANVNNTLFSNETALYTDAFGESTLTPVNRQEIVINPKGETIQISNRGNTLIPQDGYVLSLGYNPKNIQVGDKVQLLVSTTPETPSIPKNLISQSTQVSSPSFSAVSGIPILIQNGIISDKVNTGKNGFYTKPHARTAVGIKKNGDYVIVVAANVYSPSLKDFSFDRISALFSTNKKIDRQGIQQDSIGLTIKELAKLMLDLGCIDAINLDGGGSSTLYINGKVVNNPMGDEDEGLGQVLIRPVSNALVFKKRS